MFKKTSRTFKIVKKNIFALNCVAMDKSINMWPDLGTTTAHRYHSDSLDVMKPIHVEKAARVS